MAGGIQLAPLLTQMKVDIRTFKSDMDKVKVEAVGRAKEVSKSMEGAAKVGEKMSSIGGKMTKTITLPIVGAGVAAAKFSMDFSDSLAKVNTIADTTKVPLGDLKKGVLDLSDKTGMAATELNEGLYQAISASVDTADAVDFLGVAVKAAKGGFTDTTTAVDGLTTVLNSYGMESSEVDKIANQMLITQNKGKTTFGELASSVGKVTPIAAQLGITTEELFSSLASTTAQGLATSESVTAVKAAMSNIIKPSKEAADAAEMLGIKFSASEVKSKGWMPFLQELKQKLAKASPEFAKMSKQMSTNAKKMNELEKAGKKSSKEYKELSKANKGLSKDMELMAKASDSPLSAFATMFGSVEGLNSVLMMTSDNGMSIYNDTMKEMKTNTNALNDAYEKMDKTPGTEMKKAWNDIKNLGIEMGDILMPVIRDVMKDIRGLTERFKKLNPHTKEAIVKTALFAAAMGPVLSGTGTAIKLFTKLKPKVSGTTLAFKKGVPVVEKLASRFDRTTLATGGMTRGLGLLGGSSKLAMLGVKGLGLICSPVGLAIAGLGAGIYTVHEYNKAMGESCLKSSDDMGFMEKAINKVTGQTVYSKDELHKYGLEYKNFSKVSKGTNKSLKDITKSVGDLKLELETRISLDKVITQDDVEVLHNKVTNLYKKIKGTIDEENSKIRQELEEVMKADDGIIDKQEEEMINKEIEKNKTRLKSLDDYMKKIGELEQKLTKQQGQEREKTMKEIEVYYEKMGEIGKQATVKSKEELKAINKQFHEEIKGLDLKSSMEILTNKEKETKKELDIQNKKYDGLIATARKREATATGEEQKFWAQRVKELQEQKQEHIDIEREKFLGMLKVLKEKFPEITQMYNLETGKQLTKSEQAKQKELENYTSKMEGINGITKTGWYKVRNTQDNKLHEIYVNVNDTTGQIEQVWDTTVAGVYGKPIKAREEIAEELKNGVAFQPIGNAWNTTKEDIYSNRLTVAYPEIPQGLFDDVRTQWLETMRDTGNWGKYHGGHSSPTGVTWNGSYYNGLSYVPFDGYIARLHKGERIMTENENRDYIQGNNGPKGVNVTNNFYGRVDSPYEVAKASKKAMRDLSFG